MPQQVKGHIREGRPVRPYVRRGQPSMTALQRRGLLSTIDISDTDYSPEARELELWIENDADLQRQYEKAFVVNALRKKEKGTYDSEKAVDLFMYLVDRGARSYTDEFGYPGQRVVDMGFTNPVRRAVARSIRDKFEANEAAGYYDGVNIARGA